MNPIFYIARRYMFAKSSQNVINIINRVTAFVVVLGAAALFIVLAGFAGLKHFTLSFSSTFDPDLKILPAKGKYLSLTSYHYARWGKLPVAEHNDTINFVYFRILLIYPFDVSYMIFLIMGEKYLLFEHLSKVCYLTDLL